MAEILRTCVVLWAACWIRGHNAIGSSSVRTSSSPLLNMLARTPVATSLAQGVRAMSASAKVWINKDTKVICQGFTGKQV